MDWFSFNVWSAIGSVISGFSAVAVAFLTYALIKENKLLRKAGSLPHVVSHFELHPDGNGSVRLAFSNVGTGPALNVSYSFEYELNDFENYDILFRFAEERPAMTMIGQGEKFSFAFAIGFKLFQPRDLNVSRQLKPFYVKVNWCSPGDKHVYSEKYLLDISAYAGLPGVIERPPIVKIADELTAIKQQLTMLKNDYSDQNARKQSFDTTHLEQSI